MGTVLRAAAAYVVLLFIIRIVGRRTISQMAPFDLIVLFIVGGLMIQAIVGPDHSMTNGILAVVTVGLLHVGIATLKLRYPRVADIVDGTPVIVFSGGQWRRDRMAQMRVQEQDVMAAAREQGLQRLDQVRFAIVERNGRVTVIRQEKG
jgi:uncharacterized membrane protein YcaP (DUF421 family)